MIQLILYSLMFITSIIFINMIHLLAMGLTLLIQTILIGLTTGLMKKDFGILMFFF